MPIQYGQTDPDKASATPSKRSVGDSLLCGFRHCCPQCKQHTLMSGYLKVADSCTQCGEEFHHQRADDAPPYFTILITGHILVPLMVSVYASTNWPMGVHMTLWPVVAMIAVLTLLPRVKGALVALQWALRMHGFSEPDDLTPSHAEI